MHLNEDWNALKSGLQWLRQRPVLVLSGLAAVLTLLLRRERGLRQTAEAEQAGAESRGKLEVLNEDLKKAEEDAADSRTEYERLAAKHRGGGGS